MFTTITDARHAGFEPVVPVYFGMVQYGGERITVKGRELVRNAQVALCRSGWRSSGRTVPKGTEPHAIISYGYNTYPVYRKDQTVPRIRPAPPQLVPIVSAVWALNRHAKRLREAAQNYYCAKLHGFARHAKEKKESCYWLKGQALHYLVQGGMLQVVGYHWFGENLAEVLKGDGYTFHRPCAIPDPPPDKARQLEEIEAKPKKSKEPRLMDAWHTVKDYLQDKPPVMLHDWPPNSFSKSHRYDSWEPDEDLEDWDEDE